MKRNEFPYQLTEFINKVNARYDGDPLGDYVMAEDMNEVQEAISRIEKALGIRKSTLSIEDRLEQLNKFTPVQVPQIGYFESLETENMNYKNEIVQRYEFLILSRVSDLTKELSEKKVYGQVNVSGLSLEDIQNQIVQWKQRGAVGIYLNNLEKQTRAEEDSIVRSVTQEGLDLIVSGNTLKLLTNTVNSYNPEGLPLSFKENTKFIFKDFGHDNQLTQADVVMSQLLPIVRLVRQNNHELIAFTDARSKEIYNSVHTLSILLSFDYHYWGVAGGSTFERLPYTYNWPLMLSDWRTKDPQIFYINNYLERHLLNGTITFSETEGVNFYGIQTSSDGIEWLKETIPGESIEKGTLSPDRLSTYDVDRIVRLINEAPESVRIHPTKIDSDDANVFLSTNIPASHMIQNVIEAINKKNSTDSLEKDRIEEFAIKSVSGSKITGSVLIPQLVENTILAINQSNTAFDAPEPLFIDIPYADITNLQGRGTLDFASVIAGAGTFTNAQIKNTLNTYEIHNETIITSAEAEISFIKADRIQVTQLEGLKSLYVPEIEADNMETLVLQAVEAKIDEGHFNSIVTKSLESEVVISEVIYATTNFAALSDIDKGRISSLVSDIIVAKYAFIGDLQAGTINTDNIQLVSDSGLMNIHGDTFKVYSYPDENNVRNLRVLIGHLEEVTGNKEDYGFVALSKDGQTRILDHTGVYEGGIHKDAVTEETIKDQSVTGGKIKYQSIQADHLIGKIITGDWIDGETITSRHIVANAITAEKLDAKSIKGYHIDGAIIEGAHINGAIIEAKHILAGAITADKLNITYGINLMKQGFDSFEQYSDGPIELSVGNPKVVNKNKDVQTEIQSSYSLDGNKALRVMSIKNNAKLHIGQPVAINSDMPHGVSAFVRTPQGFPLSSIEIGAFLTNSELKDVTPPEFTEEEDRAYEEIGVYVSSEPQELKNSYHRFSFVVEDMQGYNFIVPIITLTESNQTIIVDAIQLEELEVGAGVSPWRTTSATTISGDNINTGRIDAKHIQIGQGTIFADGDIIEITDQGIIAKSQKGSAALNSKGLEIKGGAFDISSVLENKSFRIANGKLTAESLFNLIEIDPDKGFRIIDKRNKQILFDTDPNTGEIRMSGTFRVYSKNNPEMNYDPDSTWTIEDKINEIEEEIENIELTPGPSGKTAYEIAVEEGFSGSEKEWINSLVGKVGPGGKTAYELALDNGFSGSQEEWLNSLVGTDGEDSYSSSLSNDNHTINTDSNGENGFYTGAETTLSIFKGNKNDTANWSITIEEGPGITGEFDKEKYTYKLTNISVDASRVIFKASKEGQEDIIKVFTVNRLKAATKGQDAITYLLSLDTFYLRRDREKETITPSEFSVIGTKTVGGRAPKTEHGYFVVYEQLEDSITIDSYTDMVYKSLVELEKEYIISGVDFPYVKRYQSLAPENEIRLTPSANILKLHIEWYEDQDLTILRDVEQVPVVSDGQDTYRVEIKSLNGDTFKNGIIDTWLYATVYKGSRDVTSEIEERRFEWTRMSIDEDGDKLWNDRYYGGRKEIKITHQDVYKRATFTCSIRKQ